MQTKGLMEEIQHAKNAGVAIDVQGIVVLVRLHVIFPTVDTDAEREARSRHGRDGIGVNRSRCVSELVFARYVVVALRAIDVLRSEQIHIFSLHGAGQ